MSEARGQCLCTGMLYLIKEVKPLLLSGSGPVSSISGPEARGSKPHPLIVPHGLVTFGSHLLQSSISIGNVIHALNLNNITVTPT